MNKKQYKIKKCHERRRKSYYVIYRNHVRTKIPLSEFTEKELVRYLFFTYGNKNKRRSKKFFINELIYRNNKQKINI